MVDSILTEVGGGPRTILNRRDQAGFLRRGGSTLFPEEIELLGNVVGRHLAHLQGNAGQDTLSLAQLGAIVTLVLVDDLRPKAAKRLLKTNVLSQRFAEYPGSPVPAPEPRRSRRAALPPRRGAPVPRLTCRLAGLLRPNRPAILPARTKFTPQGTPGG